MFGYHVIKVPLRAKYIPFRQAGIKAIKGREPETDDKGA